MARYVVMKGKMLERDADIIQQHTTDIEKDLEANDITGCLFSRFIIDEHDKDSIELCPTRKDRTRRLLSVILTRGPNAFNGFIDSLEDSDYIPLAAKLRGKELDAHDRKRNWEQGQYITEQVRMLDARIVRLEEGTVSNETLSEKVEAVIIDVRSIKELLKRVQDLSRASKETENTINALKEELKEKERLLDEARKKIEDLEKKVNDLEGINLTLQKNLEQQRKDIDKLNQTVDEDRKKREELERDVKEMKTEFKKQVWQIRQPTPVAQHPPPRNQRERREIPKIKPKNRFQPDREYRK